MYSAVDRELRLVQGSLDKAKGVSTWKILLVKMTSAKVKLGRRAGQRRYRGREESRTFFTIEMGPLKT